ncbi:MAG: hypothetical protein IPH35_13685 [Rhodoferax sp.]|nr:hypothetical protein [Rhodoferax sp.]
MDKLSHNQAVNEAIDDADYIIEQSLAASRELFPGAKDEIGLRLAAMHAHVTAEVYCSLLQLEHSKVL